MLLLLLLLVLSLRSLLVLVLLRSLQDLRRILTLRATGHARERRLAMGELLRWKSLRRTLVLHLLDGRCAARLVADALCTHHGLHLVETHQLAGLASLRCRTRRWRVRLGLVVGLRGLLLRLQPPDVGARLELRDVLGVLVAFIAAAVGLRGLGYRRLVLLRRTLASLEEHLLLLQDVGHLGGLAGEVKVLVNGLLDRRTAKGVVVEGIVRVVELVAKAIVCLFEIDDIVVACPAAAQSSKSVVLAEAGRIGRVAAITRQIGVEAEERHGGGSGVVVVVSVRVSNILAAALW